MKGQQVGFLGLGIMGSAMAHNLLRGGYEVHVWNRNRSRAEKLIEAGAKWCETPGELAEQVETVQICVTDGSAVEEVIFGEQGLMDTDSGVRTIIDHSTISPSEARSFADELVLAGTTYLDAPVSGGDVGAYQGTLTIMVGGEKEAFENSREILNWIGKNIIYTGDSGSGQLTKCVNQLVVAINVAAMTEGLVFAEQAGLNPETTLKAISGGAAGSWSLDNYAPRLLEGQYGPGFFAKDMLKDLRIAMNQADELGMTLPVSSLLKQLYTAFCGSGNGELGNHALKKLYESFSSKG